MLTEGLFTWWNAVYSLPLAFVLVFLTITSAVSLAGGAVGELGQGHADAGAEHDAGLGSDHQPELDAHAEVDADADLDVDAHVHVEADADLDHDLDLDHDGEITPVERAVHVAHGHSTPGDHGMLVSALVMIGAGRAPMMMLLQILLLLWGLIGIGLHGALHAAGPAALLWSVPATFLLSVLGTRGFAGLFGRFFKQKESYALRRNEMVGRIGRVVYPVSAEAGTVHLRDRYGTLHRVRARTEHGQLESGREIIIVGYDPKSSLYQVDDSSKFVERA